MQYDVIIMGGGPVGAALAIELGLNQIKTLVLEKYDTPLQTPRAQSLSARTMEFFKRWGIDKELENEILLPQNYPQKGIWGSTLNGKLYFSALCGDNDLNIADSPKEAIRIPLWLTEKVLRKRIDSLETVTYLTKHDVCHAEIMDNHIEVTAKNHTSSSKTKCQAKFLACCDGATGVSKRIFQNDFKDLSAVTQVLSISFLSHEINDLKTLPDGIFYSINTLEVSGFLSPIDINQGLWLGQVIWNNTQLPSHKEVSEILNRMVGVEFQKVIKEFHIWNMQVQIAKFFNFNNKVFWLGDAAHAFAPTGGLGLNTGFGDAQNLGWKLSEVINGKKDRNFLLTYEIERKPVWNNNLKFAKKNAEDLIKIKQLYDEDKNYESFVLANAKLGKQFLTSSRLTLGYNYVSEENNLDFNNINSLKYTPKCERGFFIPNVVLKSGKTIHDLLSPNQWNLIILGDSEIDECFKKDNLNIIKLPINTYDKKRLILLRPDWHIEKVKYECCNIKNSCK